MKGLDVKLAEYLLTFFFFVFYWRICQFIFNRFVPLSPGTQIFSLTLTFLLIPVSMISTAVLARILRKSA